MRPLNIYSERERGYFYSQGQRYEPLDIVSRHPERQSTPQAVPVMGSGTNIPRIYVQGVSTPSPVSIPRSV
jgi:hypothetical protein